MALTITDTAPQSGVPYVPGNLWTVTKTVVLDNSYAANGEPLSLRELGFGTEAVFHHANVLSVRNLSEQAVFVPTTAYYDGEKLHLYDAATGKELAGTKDVSKVTVQLEVYCSSN